MEMDKNKNNIFTNEGNLKSTLENLLFQLKETVYSKLDSEGKENLERLNKKLKNNIVNFVVVGQFKRGKSTFINALLGDKILPTGVIPLTSIITIVKYSDTFRAIVYFNNNTTKEVTITELPEYIAEKENPGNIKNVNHILILHPANILKKGMVFVDTPGVGSLNLDNTKLTTEYISKIDAAIFVTSTDPALSDAEILFLEKILTITDKIFIIINKIDYLNKNELEEFCNYTNSQLQKRFENRSVNIFYVSAKEALNSKLENNHPALLKSGFLDLENNIINFFETEKENILLESIKRQLKEFIEEIEISFELEIKSLFLPIELLKEKISLLNNNLSIIQKGEKEFTKKLKQENKILLDNYKERLYYVKSEIIEEIKQGLYKFKEENTGMKLAEYETSLEKLFRELVENKMENARIRIEKEIKEKSLYLYQEILENFNDKINEIYKITSEIFDFELNKIHINIEYNFPTEFEYITYDFSLMFNLDKSTFKFLFPKETRKKILFDKFLNRLEFTINYNFGYIIDSIERRLEKNLLDYNIKLKNKLNETIDRIKEILNNVVKIREREKLKYDSIIKSLTDKKEKIKLLKESLINI